MVIFAFWPLLLIGGILLFLYFVQKNAHFNGLKLVLVGYSSILLLAVIVYYALPNSHFIADRLEQPDVDRDKLHETFYYSVTDGTIDQLDGVDKIREWNFAYQENELDIAQLDNLNMMTVFERKESDDGVIDVIYYATNTKLYGIDFASHASLPQVEIQNKNIKAFIPDEFANRFEISVFQNDFVLSQFKGGGIGFFDHDTIERPLDDEAMYIKIPKNLKLTGSEYSNIVGEDWE